MWGNLNGEDRAVVRRQGEADQYDVRTGDAKNSFFAHAACHHGVDGLVEEGAEVELFRWKEGC